MSNWEIVIASGLLSAFVSLIVFYIRYITGRY